MFAKVHKPLKATGGNNKGSSANLMDYLDKENKGKAEDELRNFFNEDKEDINKNEAKQLIDSNNKRLSEKDTKFYMLTLNPSQRETQHLEKIVAGKQTFDYNNPKHIKGLENLLKDYIKEVMGLYADNFEREDINGNPIELTTKDLKFVAKIEHGRSWKYNDKLVQENRAINVEVKKLQNEFKIEKDPINKAILNNRIEGLKGNLIKQDNTGRVGKDIEGEVLKTDLEKTGKNSHVHIVASRQTTSLWYKGTRIVDGEGNLHPDYDKESKAFKNARPMKLSPDANAKNKSDKQLLNGRKVNNGFNHERFKENCIDKFEKKYKFKANEKESYKSNSYNRIVTNQINKGKVKVKGIIQKELLGEVNNDVQKIKTVVQTIKQVKTPTKLGINKLKELAQELGKPSIKDILKGL